MYRVARRGHIAFCAVYIDKVCAMCRVMYIFTSFCFSLSHCRNLYYRCYEFMRICTHVHSVIFSLEVFVLFIGYICHVWYYRCIRFLVVILLEVIKQKVFGHNSALGIDITDKVVFWTVWRLFLGTMGVSQHDIPTCRRHFDIGNTHTHNTYWWINNNNDNSERVG